MSSITIIGTGNMARSLAIRFLAGGNDVQILGHSAEKAKQLASELDSESVSTGVAGDRIVSDIVVLAVWYDTAMSLVRELGESLAGKTVVDISNPVDVSNFDGLVTPPDSSSAEEIAKAAPGSTNVVKAFNTTFAGTLSSGEVAGTQLDVLVAGDDTDAKRSTSAEHQTVAPVDGSSTCRLHPLEFSVTYTRPDGSMVAPTLMLPSKSRCQASTTSSGPTSGE